MLNDAGEELQHSEPGDGIHKATWQQPRSKKWHCIDYAIMKQYRNTAVSKWKIGNGSLWHFTYEGENNFQCLFSTRTKAVALKHCVKVDRTLV